MKKKLLLADFLLQAVSVLPMLLCDILVLAGIAFGSDSLLEYMIYGLILAAPVGGSQLLSCLIWLVRGDSRFHKMYIFAAALVGGFTIYVLMGGQGIPNALFWYLMITAKLMSAFYWVNTLVLWRRA